jgi:hypothetical protein
VKFFKAAGWGDARKSAAGLLFEAFFELFDEGWQYAVNGRSLNSQNNTVDTNAVKQGRVKT